MTVADAATKAWTGSGAVYAEVSCDARGAIFTRPMPVRIIRVARAGDGVGADAVGSTLRSFCKVALFVTHGSDPARGALIAGATLPVSCGERGVTRARHVSVAGAMHGARVGETPWASQRAVSPGATITASARTSSEIAISTGSIATAYGTVGDRTLYGAIAGGETRIAVATTGGRACAVSAARVGYATRANERAGSPGVSQEAGAASITILPFRTEAMVIAWCTVTTVTFLVAVGTVIPGVRARVACATVRVASGATIQRIAVAGTVGTCPGSAAHKSIAADWACDGASSTGVEGAARAALRTDPIAMGRV